MKLSTKSRYGLRLMLELGLFYQKGPIHLDTIAKSQDISIKYLEQIANHLKTSNLIESKRGAGGGYFISKNTKDITLKDIIESLEGSLSLVDCVEDADCERMFKCVACDIWKMLSDTIKTTLEKVTLAELVVKYKKKKDSSENGNIEYYI